MKSGLTPASFPPRRTFKSKFTSFELNFVNRFDTEVSTYILIFYIYDVIKWCTNLDKTYLRFFGLHKFCNQIWYWSIYLPTYWDFIWRYQRVYLLHMRKNVSRSRVTSFELKFVNKFLIEVSTYILEVLCRQPIKLFQVVSTSEFHEY